MQNDGQNDSLNMARIEQEKANEGVRILVEKHKVSISTLQLLVSFKCLLNSRI
jgi:hypothetical protein